MNKTNGAPITKDEAIYLIPKKEIGIELDSPVLGTKSRISKLSILKHPLYVVKEYLNSAKDLSGIEGEEAAMAAYNLEKTVLITIPRSEMNRVVDGKTIQVFPKLSRSDDNKKRLLLEYIPYPTLIEKMEGGGTPGRLELIDFSLDTWIILCDRLAKYKDAIESKLGHPLKKVTKQEEFEKFLRYTDLIFGKDNISPGKIKDSFYGLFTRALANTTVIHGSYYPDHIRLNGERSVNLDAGGIRIGPLEMDIGYMLTDLAYLFNDIQVPVKHIVSDYPTRVGEFPQLPKSVSEESIALFVLLGSLKKAAGIKLRKNHDEMPRAKNLIENISKITVFGSEDLSILTKVLQDAKEAKESK